MKTVLITGGFGNIGIRIMDELYAQGYHIRCLDLPNNANKKTAKRYRNKAEVIWGDITDSETVFSAVTDVDAVIHTAAIESKR